MRVFAPPKCRRLSDSTHVPSPLAATIVRLARARARYCFVSNSFPFLTYFHIRSSFARSTLPLATGINVVTYTILLKGVCEDGNMAAAAAILRVLLNADDAATAADDAATAADDAVAAAAADGNDDVDMTEKIVTSNGNGNGNGNSNGNGNGSTKSSDVTSKRARLVNARLLDTCLRGCVMHGDDILANFIFDGDDASDDNFGGGKNTSDSGSNFGISNVTGGVGGGGVVSRPAAMARANVAPSSHSYEYLIRVLCSHLDIDGAWKAALR
jgi:hypothetical protein